MENNHEYKMWTKTAELLVQHQTFQRFELIAKIKFFKTLKNCIKVEIQMSEKGLQNKQKTLFLFIR
jgi:hypothetical protein